MAPNYKKYPTIHIPLLEHAIKERIIPQVRLWLWLKYNSTGALLLNHEQIIKALNYGSKKTLIKHLDWLHTNGWIGFSKRDVVPARLHVRPHKRLFKYYGWKNRNAVLLENRAAFDSNQAFRGFATGAILAAMVKFQKQRNWKKDRLETSERNTRRSDPQAKGPIFSISKTLIAERLNISTGQATKLKQLACKYGFIKVKKQRKLIDQASPSAYQHLNRIRKYEGSCPLIIDNGKLYRQLPDEIIPCLHVKTLRKSRIF